MGMTYKIGVKGKQVILNFRNGEPDEDNDNDIYIVVFSAASFAQFVEKCSEARTKIPGYW